jgi:DNA-directed RNA polymerase specialized sigma24 family protein
MDTPGTVSHWLDALRGGEPDAAQRLWEAYYRRLVGLAHKNLGAAPRGPADSEDVVLSALDSFYRGVAGGRFPKLADRDDLWQVLVMLTVRKAGNAVRKEFAQKRGGGQNGHQLPPDAAADGPTPDEAAELMDELRNRLASLGDPELQALAVAKMEGQTNAEIAARTGWSLAKVERKLARIRRTWEASPADG